MNPATKQVRMLGIAALALALGGCGGCGDELDVNNVNPEGSVGGLIVDAVTRAPIEGVTLHVLAGGEVLEAVTAADGSFVFEDVPAGEILVTIEAPAGYRGAWIRDMLPNDAGEFPTGNSTVTLGPIGLVPITESFSVRVLDQNGKPVSQYGLVLRHFVEYVDFSTAPGEDVNRNRGEVVIEATTDTSGYATFPDMPNFYALTPEVNDTVLVLLPPLDADEDSVFEYDGGSKSFSMRSLDDPTPDIILDPDYTWTTLSIRASTIDQLAGAEGTNPLPTVLGINDVIHVAFNLPIQNGVEIYISDEYGDLVAQAPSISVGGDNLAINFGGDPLLPGNEYNIHIRAVAAVGERFVSGDFSAAFFTAGISDDVTVTTSRTGNLLYLEFSEPIGVGNGSQSLLSEGNCVLFITYDLNNTGALDDFALESGQTNCNHPDADDPYYLRSVEPNPYGVPGLSGYTKYWRLQLPQYETATVPADLPAGTLVHLLFSRVPNGAYVVERTDGRRVADFTGTTVIEIP